MPAHPDFTARFAAGLRDGILPPGLTAKMPDEAARRFAVYRNNVAIGLIDALAARFPVIRRLLGEDFFRAMARVFAETHRPRSPVLLDWGADLPGFLETFPPLAAHPYLADIARIEHARGLAFHAADRPPLLPAALAGADPSRLRLCLHPSVQVLRLAHPAVSIWAANQPGRDPGGPFPPAAETALILRDTRFDVPVAAIGPGDAALVEALRTGAPLTAAAHRAATAQPAHDPQPILVRLMQAGALITPGRTDDETPDPQPEPGACPCSE
ncbi:DNA-binding domain-containing protein [Rhodovulum steppense]|uniref:HvfC/BufC N-terminal domain-containing protein n=1 Tax=Rhodovulum steppense TaxID=540251 RepID=UPI001404BCBD|nr:putative DNA-binding domain-containing protein [Rhodovulum steppense]